MKFVYYLLMLDLEGMNTFTNFFDILTWDTISLLKGITWNELLHDFSYFYKTAIFTFFVLNI